MNGGHSFFSLFAIPGNKAIKIVAVGSVCLKRFLVEQPFDTAAQTHLIGVTLGANWPTHLSVPAPTKQHHAGASQAGSQTQRPRPARFLLLVTHLPQPVSGSKT